MGMHVYIPFVCLRCLELLANLLIFGESRDILQLKVVGAGFHPPGPLTSAYNRVWVLGVWFSTQDAAQWEP